MAVAPARRRTLDGPLLVALLVMLIWALNAVGVKWAIGQWQPLLYAALRFAIGGTLFALWVLAREGSLRIARRDLALAVASGLVGVFVNQIGFMRATQHTTASTVMLIMVTAPAWAAIFAGLARQERVSRHHWVGIGIAGVGVALILEASATGLDLTSLQGDLYGLVMAATWAAYSVMMRPLVARYSAARVSAIALLTGAPFLLVAGWSEAQRQDWGAITWGGWAMLGFSAIASLVVTNVLWFDAVRRVGAARISATLPIQPVTGVVLAMVLLGERISPQELLGGAIAIVGVLWTQR